MFISQWNYWMCNSLYHVVFASSGNHHRCSWLLLVIQAVKLAPEWYLQPGSWAEKKSLHHEEKKQKTKKNTNSMKTFVQDIWCKVTTVQWFHSWCFDCCKLSSSSQHQPHAIKKQKKQKKTRHKWGLVLKSDSVEMKSPLVQRVHKQKKETVFFCGICWSLSLSREKQQPAGSSFW